MAINIITRAITLVLAALLCASSIHAQYSENDAISAGSMHTIFLRNGSVRGWGADYFGPNEAYPDAFSTPAWVEGLSANIAGISAGADHSLFLKSDGSVWGCGNNRHGQLGTGKAYIDEYPEERHPVPIAGLSAVKEISAGENFSLFLKKNGTVWACGRNSQGQLGDGTKTDQLRPIQIPGLSGVTAIATGQNHSLFLKGDGTVWGCGWNQYSQLGKESYINGNDYGSFDSIVQVPGLTGVIAVAAGVYHSLFVMSDGTVRACGGNSFGQLGIGTRSEATYGISATPVPVPGLTGIQSISGGERYSLFLKDDGTVWACGSSSDGRLGVVPFGPDRKNDRLSPVQVTGFSDVKAISAGWAHSLFLTGDGGVWAFGRNWHGQVGIDHSFETGRQEQPTPVRIMNSDTGTEPLLSSLSILPGQLQTTFNPLTEAYTSSVSNQVSSLRVLASTLVQESTITVNGNEVDSGVASGLIPLRVGLNKIIIVVHAPGGVGFKTYRVLVNRKKSSDARLRGLVLDEAKISPVFRTGVLSYSGKVGGKTSYVHVRPTSNHGNASILVNGILTGSGRLSKRIPLKLGKNTITVGVTAEDGTKRTYKIVVNRG